MGECVDVLIVVTTAGRRGAELEGLDLARELEGTGRSVKIVALTPGTGTVESIPALGPAALGATALRQLRKLGRSAAVVVAYGSTTLPACSISLAGTGVPFVYRSIGDPAEWVRGPLHRLRTRALFKRAAHVVALWPGARDDINQLYSIDKNSISVIPNARSEERFTRPTQEERTSARAAWGIDDDRPVIVSLGSLSPEKQTDRAIRAMAELPTAHLLVAGDGPERRSIDDLAASCPTGNVTVIGSVDDPRTVLHAADVLLLASRTEGMPGVIIEAGLCGVPSVAPPVGAIRSLIEHGVSGFITVGDDPGDLAEGLRRTIAAQRDFGDAAAARMRDQFTWDVVTPRWTQLLDRIER